MRAYSAMFAMLCLNAGFYLMTAIGITTVNYKLGDPSTLLSSTLYGGDVVALIGGLAPYLATGGLVYLLTRSYIYAAGILAVWCAITLAPIINTFFSAMPDIMGLLGVPPAMTLVVRLMFAFIFVLFMLEVIGQRQVS